MIAPFAVHAAAKKLEDENLKFRVFLKNHADGDELDQQFLILHRELFSEYDCRQCGNCCRAYSTSLTEDEMDAIAAFVGSTKEEFTRQFLVQGLDGYELKAPCRFLNKDGTCQIQDCKPSECRGFPYTDKSGRLESLLSILSFAEECPVVFEMIQRLKDIYGFRR